MKASSESGLWATWIVLGMGAPYIRQQSLKQVSDGSRSPPLMAYRSLRDFLDRLERAGELVRVREPVDLKLDMAALADRAAKQQGPALLFEKPSSGIMPVAMNLFGTRRRAAWALSCEDLEEPASELRALLKMAPPQGLWDKLRMIPKLGRLASLPPKHVSSGPVQEAVDREPDLASIPV